MKTVISLAACSLSLALSNVGTRPGGRVKQFLSAAGGETEVKVIRGGFGPKTHERRETATPSRGQPVTPGAAGWRPDDGDLTGAACVSLPSLRWNAACSSGSTCVSGVFFSWSYITSVYGSYSAVIPSDCNYSLHTEQLQCTQVAAESLLYGERAHWRVFIWYFNPTVTQLCWDVQVWVLSYAFEPAGLLLKDQL